MRNRLFSETELIELAKAEVQSRLPRDWRLESKRTPTRRGRRADALWVVRAPDGTSSTIVVEAKQSIDPRDVPLVLEQVRSFADARPLVVAPFLSPLARDRLISAGAGYADATGNVRLTLDSPAVFIDSLGARSNPWPDERPLRSLKGPTSGRIVRALCDFKPPYGIRELADLAGASPASVSRVVDVLEREALMTRQPRGAIERIDWPELLRRWSDDYSFTESNRTKMFLEPRGFQSFLDKFAQSKLGYAVTGSIAAAQFVRAAPARLAVAYVSRLDKAADALRLDAVEAGANVILAEPFDSVVFERTSEFGGIIIAAPSQVAADLLSSPGRGPAEAQELITWMRQNENAWRR